MKAKELMSSPAITVPADASIMQIALTMRQNHISGVPVVDSGGKLLGLVTELDLITRNAPVVSPSYIYLLSGYLPVDIQQHQHYREQMRQILATTAGELMSKDVKCIQLGTDLESVMKLMENPEIIQLPVLETGRVVGVVTRTDLVRLIEKLEMVSEYPESQISA